jgi:hypothetical protein
LFQNLRPKIEIFINSFFNVALFRIRMKCGRSVCQDGGQPSGAARQGQRSVLVVTFQRDGAVRTCGH